MSSISNNYNNKSSQRGYDGKRVPSENSDLKNLDGFMDEVATELILSADDPEREAKRILYGVDEETSSGETKD